MLNIQIQLLAAWSAVSSTLHRRLHDARHDDRGEVTATTVIIVLLVVAAIAAGGIIAGKIIDNANNVPSP